MSTEAEFEVPEGWKKGQAIDVRKVILHEGGYIWIVSGRRSPFSLSAFKTAALESVSLDLIAELRFYSDQEYLAWREWWFCEYREILKAGGYNEKIAEAIETIITPWALTSDDLKAGTHILHQACYRGVITWDELAALSQRAPGLLKNATSLLQRTREDDSGELPLPDLVDNLKL